MAYVKFKRGLKSKLPSSGDNGTIYITTDTQEMYKCFADNGALKKIGDTLIVNELPVEPIENKIYILVRDSSMEVYAYVGEWLSLQGTVDESFIMNLMGIANTSEALSYDTSGNVTNIVTTGEINKNTVYTYDGENVIKEEITQGDLKITKTFVYDGEDIVGINTVVDTQ